MQEIAAHLRKPLDDTGASAASLRAGKQHHPLQHRVHHLHWIRRVHQYLRQADGVRGTDEGRGFGYKRVQEVDVSRRGGSGLACKGGNHLG